MCDKALDDFLTVLKLITNQYVTSNIIKKLFTALYTIENILYVNKDSGNLVFSCNEMGILNIDINNVNLGNNFDEDDRGTIIHIRLLAWHIKFEKCETRKK